MDQGTTAPGNAVPYNVAEGTYGPHSSRLANAADPRVDSDRDHRGAPVQMGTTGAAYGTSVSAAGHDVPEGSYGPHSSRLANAADPRVDSDRDHRAAPLGAPVGGAPAAGAHTGGAPAAGVPTANVPAAGGISAAYGSSGVTGGSYVAGGTPATAPVAAENSGERAGRNIKGVFAQGHGLGEILRGNINAAIDTLTGDKVGQAKDEETARRGYREFETRQFEKKGPTDKVL